jgi:hypothetical protein
LVSITTIIDNIRNIDQYVGENAGDEEAENKHEPTPPGEIPPEKFVDNADELFTRLKE